MVVRSMPHPSRVKDPALLFFFLYNTEPGAFLAYQEDFPAIYCVLQTKQ